MSLRVLAVVPERPGGVGERALHAERRVRHALRLQPGQQQRHRAARVRAKHNDDVAKKLQFPQGQEGMETHQRDLGVWDRAKIWYWSGGNRSQLLGGFCASWVLSTRQLCYRLIVV